MRRTSPNRSCTLIVLATWLASVAGLSPGYGAPPPATQPDRVYVPYDKLKGVFDAERQGVFLPLVEFQRLWNAAQGAPAAVQGLAADYLVSSCRLTGKADAELAFMQMELTVDVLVDGWLSVPIGLGDAAVVKAVLMQDWAPNPEKSGSGTPDGGAARIVEPLLRVVDGQYTLLTRGRGRRSLKLDFVRQLVSKTGLNVLSLRIPAAAISTLELTIPEPNMKVDVRPMLAASTSPIDLEGKPATRLQAFLGQANAVELTWKPKTQAAEELEAVVIAEQLQHIHVAEALVSQQIHFSYDIRRRGVDAFTVQLPADFRVTAVEGENMSKWEIAAPPAGRGEPAGPQLLKVTLFSPAKDAYSLTVKLERFVQEATAEIPLTAVLTQQCLRGTGLIAVTHSPRRSVQLRDAKGLARVDVGRLPENLRNEPGVTAYRFISPDYGGVLAVGTVQPRITANQLWAMGVDTDRLELRGRLTYTIERAGVFQLALALPEPWEIASVGPAHVVDDHQLATDKATGLRTLTVLLKNEMTGQVTVELAARARRPAPDAPVRFVLPQPDSRDLQLYTGQLAVFLADRFRAEVEKLDQLTALPLNQAAGWTSWPGQSAAMAFEFRAIEPGKPAGVNLKIAVKPAQVSATVHRLVTIQQDSIEQEAVIDYHVLYAPVDTFYLKLPAELADGGIEISGAQIKERPRIADLPADQTMAPSTQPAADLPAGRQADVEKWAYYKIVLQSPVTGDYRATVQWRRPSNIGQAGAKADITVEPVLAAGKLSDQSGYIAVAKSDMLSLGEPETANLVAGDPGSAADLPYGPHRDKAIRAFKYNAPPFALTLPVIVQEEAAVFTTIVTAAIIEQVLAPDGALNTQATCLVSTSKGDRLTFNLPKGARLTAVLVNGAEAPVENAPTANQKIVRLPVSAGQVSKVVLTIAYSLDNASARRLAAPVLGKAKDVPVQQTLWRLFLPADDVVLGHSRVFTPVDSPARLLKELGRGQPVTVDFKLTGQGREYHFIRQGAPGELSVYSLGKVWFHLLVWGAILALGLMTLTASGFSRAVMVLAVVLGLLIGRLVWPLLVENLVAVCGPAAALVAALWAAHWVFGRWAMASLRRGEGKVPPTPPTAQAADEGPPPEQPQAETPPEEASEESLLDEGDQDEED